MPQTTTASGTVTSPAPVYSYESPANPTTLSDSEGNKAVRTDYTFRNTGNVAMVLHYLNVTNLNNCTLNQAGIVSGSSMVDSLTIPANGTARIHVDVKTAYLAPGTPSQDFGYSLEWKVTDEAGVEV